jgi:hypothetical protein
MSRLQRSLFIGTHPRLRRFAPSPGANLTSRLTALGASWLARSRILAIKHSDFAEQLSDLRTTTSVVIAVIWQKHMVEKSNVDPQLPRPTTLRALKARSQVSPR